MHIGVENLSFYYKKGENILDHISFELKKGDFLGIIGKSGSGKSTLIKQLMGILKPKSGKIHINGEEVTKKFYKKNLFAKSVGMVFQYPEQQLFEKSVLKDVMFGLLMQKIDPKETKLLAKKALSLVKIDEKYHHISPFELSGGQKRRVAIAGVLSMQTPILLLDEPTASLDTEGKKEILEPLKILNEKEQKTIIMASHDLQDIAQYTNKLLVIHDSKILYFDETQKVFAHGTELEKIGLKIPEGNRVLNALYSKGFDVDTSKIKLQDIAHEIYKSIKKVSP